jgi:uncharacterized membrane protein
MVTDAVTEKRPIVYAIVLIVASVAGWIAAFQLILDKLALVKDGAANLSCNFSVIVSCGKNLDSWQGSLFGFPNPILGLTGWMAPLVVAAALLAGAKFSRWFWIVFNLGIAGAMLLVIFLISQSILVIGTLCVWCMLTWFVTIPVFWMVTLRNFATGVFGVPPRPRAFFAAAYSWVPAISVVCYLAIVVLAQVRLDLLGHLLRGSL